MKIRTIPLLLLPLILSSAVVCPAPAGEEPQSVTLYSDRKGDAGWIEVDRADGRMRATPYLRVSGETFHQAVEAAARTGEARVSAGVNPRNPDPTVMTDRKTQRKEALSSLLAGPGGVSLGGVLDLARQASDSAKETFRQVREESSPPRQAGAR